MTTLTAAAAQVSFSIPFTTIPFTMQPMVVLMAGLALGPRLGTMSQMLYLAAGIAGLPVFAVSLSLPMGAARLLGPSGGYLMAYPVGGVRDRVARHPRLRSPLPDVHRSHARGSHRHLCRWHHVAGPVRESCRSVRVNWHPGRARFRRFIHSSPSIC